MGGQLIQEQTGKQTVDYVWLDGQPILQHDVHGRSNVSGAGETNKGVNTYLVSDHLNTPRIGMNEDQQTTWKWNSDGFGNAEPTIAQGTVTQINLRFPGQYADQETGLYYNWHRYYDPEIGRYVTSDPIGLIAGINTYGYVGGNPVGAVDPSGLIPLVPLITGTANAAFDGFNQYQEEQGWDASRTATAFVFGAIGGAGGSFVGTLTANGVRAGALTVGEATAFNIIGNGAVGAATSAGQGIANGENSSSEVGSNMLGGLISGGLGGAGGDLLGPLGSSLGRYTPDIIVEGLSGLINELADEEEQSIQWCSAN